MDNAVGLVQTYLQLNGYFTVTEYPVLELGRGGGRQLTDLDILAFRFPHARNAPVSPRHKVIHREANLDEGLHEPGPAGDMLIGEIKEGGAVLNRGAADPAVIAAVLVRFGCCEAREVAGLVETLLRTGEVLTPMGHRARLVAFGAYPGTGLDPKVLFISLSQILSYLETYIATNWALLRHAQFKDPVLDFLLLQAKAHQTEEPS